MKLGIRSKMFLVSLGLIASSVAAADLYLSRALGDSLTAQLRENLFVRLALAGREVSRNDAPLESTAFWEAVAEELGVAAKARITIVRNDGRVIGDSEVPGGEIGHMENHGNRPEIVDARKSGHGTSIRWSDTVQTSMMYVAVPFMRGGSAAGVIRAAVPLKQVDDSIANLQLVLMAGTLVALAFAVLMSSLSAHWMSRPVRDLTVAARRMAEGDLAIRTHVLGRDEISELAAALNHLGGSLMETLDRLREDRDLMEKVLGDMKEGVLLLGNEGRVVLVNHALRQMLYLANDVAGKYTLEVIRNADLHAMIEKAGATGETIEAEIELGHIKPLRLLVQATQLSDGTGRLLVVFVDVTEIRRLEKIRRDFVANVSHELRTPVASIRSSAETLRGALVNDPTAAVEFAGIIERNATRLGRLVDDLLDLSRIEARQFNLNPETVNLPQAVAQTLAMFKTQAGEKNIRLVAEMAAGTPAALADRRALDQVLANLIDNAIKYCQDGSTVTVRSSAVEGGIRISVEDDGPGIEARHLPRLFERFYRVDTCRSRELGGTGLGLSIVKHLVEAMGGAVAVESVPGKGSIFSISIPRA